jgi:hypothetical protein
MPVESVQQAADREPDDGVLDCCAPGRASFRMVPVVQMSSDEPTPSN